jgi:hypothetical protein
VTSRTLIENYRLAYVMPPVPPGASEQTGSSAYTAGRDPLAYVVTAADKKAVVSIGVDPGTFFCGGLLRHLSDYEALNPDVITGFIHVPPDLLSHTAPRRDSPLPTRQQNLALIGKVVDESIGLMAGRLGSQVVLLTGFGPFRGVQANVTEEFVLAQRAFGRHAAVLELGADREFALEGRYYQGMAEVKLQFEAALSAVHAQTGRSPDIIIGLGVDSAQNDLKAGEMPNFKIECQTRGFSFGGYTERDFSTRPVAHTELATRWLERHGRAL